MATSSFPRSLRNRFRKITLDRRLLVALVIAVGMVAALSTFAAGGKNHPGKGNQSKPAAGQQAKSNQSKGQQKNKQNHGKPGQSVDKEDYQAVGADYQACRAVGRNSSCQKAGTAVQAPGNYEVEYRPSNLKEGRYKTRFTYHTVGSKPANDHTLKVLLNGQKVDEVKLPPSLDNYTYVSDDFAVKKGQDKLIYKIEPAKGSQVAVQRIFVKKVENAYPNGSSRAWADKILDEANKKKRARISITGEAKGNLERIRDGGCSPVPAANACVKLDKRLLQSIYEVSQQKQKIDIWHFTEGPHVTCSNHYEGRAADIREYGGGNPKNRDLLNAFKQKGADELLGPGDPNHTDHWHVAWEGSHEHCAS